MPCAVRPVGTSAIAIMKAGPLSRLINGANIMPFRFPDRVIPPESKGLRK